VAVFRSVTSRHANLLIIGCVTFVVILTYNCTPATLQVEYLRLVTCSPFGTTNAIFPKKMVGDETFP